MFRKVFFVLALTLHGSTWALDTDREQRVELSADQLQYDQRSGISTYSGNVTVQQGSLHITGDRIEIQSNNGQFKSATAEGSPVVLVQQQNDGRMINASAQYLFYNNDAREVLLRGNAVIIQGKDRFQASEMTYHLDNETIQAKGDSRRNERVEITFEPATNDE